MIRKSIAIVFGTEPNFNKDAFKYFLLSVNKIQNTYEFCFPDTKLRPYKKNICIYDLAFEPMEEILPKIKFNSDYWVSIITKSFDNNYFFRGGKDIAVITTDVWDKYFSPPSLFEYLLHSIYTCLLCSYSTEGDIITSHRETKGCIADFTRNKYDDRIDIILGYVCDKHKEEIKSKIGETYLQELIYVTERKWIGNIEDKGSVAYNLKYIFKFDINKDSGFNKTTWDKIKDKFYEIPASLASEILKIILLALTTYFLVKFGLKMG